MSDQAFEPINPATGDAFATSPVWTEDAVEQALAQSARQAKAWAQTGCSKRRALLEAVVDHLEDERDRLAGLVTAEMGKLASEARVEVDRCVWVCRYYAEHAESILADENVQTDPQRSFGAHQPLGAVLAVSNTAIGFILCFTGVLHALGAVFSVPLVVLILSLLGFAGVARDIGCRWPDCWTHTNELISSLEKTWANRANPETMTARQSNRPAKAS